MTHSAIKTLFATSTITALLLSQAAIAADSGDTLSLGLEGFYDRYHETVSGSPFVKIDSDYGSLTTGYTHNFNPLFIALDVRASYGEGQYGSASGTASNVPQWEYELRLRGGTNIAWGTGTFSPYIGLGGRYYIDDGKGYTTNTAEHFYDRRIAQLYVPIGATYTRNLTQDLYIAPNAEFDPLIVGSVNSRLQNINSYYTPNPIFPNLYNVQRSGYGLRGEVMLGEKTTSNSNRLGWEAGPFVRYWNIKDSDLSHWATQNASGAGEEPSNTRLQLGAALRVMW